MRSPTEVEKVNAIHFQPKKTMILMKRLQRWNQQQQPRKRRRQLLQLQLRQLQPQLLLQLQLQRP